MVSAKDDDSVKNGSVAEAKSSTDWHDLVKLAETAERYDDMTEFMGQFVKQQKQLNTKDRTLLSAAFKSHIGQRRSAWRTLSALEQKYVTASEKATDKNDEAKVVTKDNEEAATTDKAAERAAQLAISVNVSRALRMEVEQEIEKIGEQVIELLDRHLIPNATCSAVDAESTEDKAADENAEPTSKSSKQLNDAEVFYWKMKGDYHRYLCEFACGDRRKKTADQALSAYKKANELAKELPIMNAVRLGLALNYSVFFYEILQLPEEAITLAKKTFDEAIELIEAADDSENNREFADCQMILQLLYDNLRLWRSEANGGVEDSTNGDMSDISPLKTGNGKDVSAGEYEIEAVNDSQN